MFKEFENIFHRERFKKSLYMNGRLLIFVALIGIIMAACSVTDEKQEQLPIIHVAPATGGPNTQVVVTGENFPAGLAVMLRLGPPDVGATPFSYASGFADDQGRFMLEFSIPESWPDGTMILESTLTVIVLNDDGSVKATAPFTMNTSNTAEPAPVIIDGVITPDLTLMANEEAIVNAVKSFLTQSGESVQVAVAVEVIEGDFARVVIIPLETIEQGNLAGYLKLVDEVWEVLVIGRDFDSDQLLELGIPATILPEDLLTPQG